jgi:hypothetical protein
MSRFDEINVKIVDIAGFENFNHCPIPNICRDVQGLIVCFSPKDHYSLKMALDLTEELKTEKYRFAENCVLRIVATKMDLFFRNFDCDFFAIEDVSFDQINLQSIMEKEYKEFETKNRNRFFDANCREEEKRSEKKVRRTPNVSKIDERKNPHDIYLKLLDSCNETVLNEKKNESDRFSFRDGKIFFVSSKVSGKIAMNPSMVIMEMISVYFSKFKNENFLLEVSGSGSYLENEDGFLTKGFDAFQIANDAETEHGESCC